MTAGDASDQESGSPYYEYVGEVTRREDTPGGSAVIAKEMFTCHACFCLIDGDYLDSHGDQHPV